MAASSDLCRDLLAARARIAETARDVQRANEAAEAARLEAELARTRHNQARCAARQAESELVARFGERCLPSLLSSPELLARAEALRSKGFCLVLEVVQPSSPGPPAGLDVMLLIVSLLHSKRDVGALLRTCSVLWSARDACWSVRKQSHGIIGRPTHQISWRACAPRAFAVLPDGALAVGCDDTIYVGEFAAGTGTASGTGTRQAAWADQLQAPAQKLCHTIGMALLPGGFIATASGEVTPDLYPGLAAYEYSEYVVYIWDSRAEPSDARQPCLALAVPRPVHCFAVLADGRLAAADDEEIHVWPRYEHGVEGLERRSFAHGYAPGPRRDIEHIWHLVELGDGSLATTCAKHGVRLFPRDAIYDGAAVRPAVEAIVCAGHAPKPGEPEYCFQLVALGGGGFASGSWHGTVKLWDPLGTCRCTMDVNEHVGPHGATRVQQMLACADGSLAVATDKRVRLFGADGSPRWALTAEDSFYSLGQLPTGHLLCLGFSHVLRVLHPADGRCTAEVPDVGASCCPGSPAVLRDGRLALLYEPAGSSYGVVGVGERVLRIYE